MRSRSHAHGMARLRRPSSLAAAAAVACCLWAASVVDASTRHHELAYVALAGGGNGQLVVHKMLESIKENLLPWTPGDVLIFHTGEFPQHSPLRDNLSSVLPGVQFHLVPSHAWQLPAGMKESDFRAGDVTHHGAGYRHMCRWYSIGLFKYLNSLGYKWVFRLDSDSEVLSKVERNMVTWMEENGKRYGYRFWGGAEYPPVVHSMAEFVAWYLTALEIKPKWLYERCKPANITGLNSFGGWNRDSISNNVFMAEIAFWLSPEVEQFVSAIVRSHGIYLFRWGDAHVHSFVVSIFLEKRQVHQFAFRYCHQGLCMGIDEGSKDPI